MKREKRTIALMIGLYCREHHPAFRTEGRDHCDGCRDLLEYAYGRLEGCPYGLDEKPSCDQCPIHCYQGDRRAQLQAVMRYAGPRMILRHPVPAALHLLGKVGKTAPGTPASRRARKQS